MNQLCQIPLPPENTHPQRHLCCIRGGGKFLLSKIILYMFTTTNYQVEGSSCSTPRKISFNQPSITSIEELRTPALEELLRLFREADSGKQPNGNVNKSARAFEAVVQSLDSRFPLTAIN